MSVTEAERKRESRANLKKEMGTEEYLRVQAKKKKEQRERAKLKKLANAPQPAPQNSSTINSTTK